MIILELAGIALACAVVADEQILMAAIFLIIVLAGCYRAIRNWRSHAARISRRLFTHIDADSYGAYPANELRADIPAQRDRRENGDTR